MEEVIKKYSQLKNKEGFYSMRALKKLEKHPVLRKEIKKETRRMQRKDERA